MHRIVIARPGGYSALEYVESSDPQPGAGEVVVEPQACGLNYADGIIRMGLYESAKKLHGYPITPRFNPLHMTRDNKSVLAVNLSFLQSHAPSLREGMLWLLARFESGELKPLPVETWPLKDAAKAQQRIESGQTIGKLALLPEGAKAPAS